MYLFAALNKFAIASILTVTAAPVALALPEAAPTAAQANADIVSVASSVDNFSTLMQAVEAAGLAEALMGPGPFTVFAPTNEAFADFDELLQDRYGIGVPDLLEPANRDLLAETLLHHVVPGAAVVSNDIPNGATVLEAANGDTIQVNRGGEDVNVDGVGVSAFDIPASNGVIHVIDDVLLSPEVIAALEERPVAAIPLPAETTTTPAPATPAPATPAPATTAPAEPVRGLW